MSSANSDGFGLEGSSDQDEGFVEVVNKKRQRSVEKKEQKEAAERAQQEQAEQHKIQQKKRDRKEKDKERKKKAKALPPPPSVSNDKELVQLLCTLIDNTPTGCLHMSAISIRLQEVTKQPWNKKFKPQYGTLKTFLEGRAEFLVLEDDKVYVKDTYARIFVKQSQKEKKKVQSKDGSESTSKPGSAKRKRRKQAEQAGADGEEGHLCFKVFVVLLIVIMACLFALVTLEVGNLGRVTADIKTWLHTIIDSVRVTAAAFTAAANRR